MENVITEITPLSDKDCFYLIDRQKDSFTYPLHRHDEYELNFVAGCRGAQRVVGDSMEILSDYDLCLIGGGIEHGWLQHTCTNQNIREITIQFSSDMFGEEFLKKNQLKSLATLLNTSKKGVSFGMDTILRTYAKLEDLINTESGFYRVLRLMEILYELANEHDRRLLSSNPFSKMDHQNESRRIHKIEEYVNKHYSENINLQDLADLVGMNANAFSRYFRTRTGRTVIEYIIDIRLGHASRLLVDTTMAISEICYECGFNNISNFNRTFKRKKGCSPSSFRENYRKYKVVI